VLIKYNFLILYYQKEKRNLYKAISEPKWTKHSNSVL